jgi:SAM-dependent methyltransferase
MTREPFGLYAEWYDRFNESKDYAREVRYLLEIVNAAGVSPATWLDVGCGTGAHLACLRAEGVAVEGVDRSAAMIARARALHPGIPFHVADAADFHVGGGRDVVSSLFHALNYLTDDHALSAAFRRFADHLRPGGAVVFDFWNTPAVRRDPPARRVRAAEIDGRTLHRVSTPDVAPDGSLVTVRFDFHWDSPEGAPAHTETHRVRPFHRLEIEAWLKDAGFTLALCEAWNARRPLADTDWYGVACARLS